MECEDRRQHTEPPSTGIHVWANFKVAIKQLQHTDPGPGQWLARCIIRMAQQLMENGTLGDVHWVLGLIGVEGIERAYEIAKEKTEKAGT